MDRLVDNISEIKFVEVYNYTAFTLCEFINFTICLKYKKLSKYNLTRMQVKLYL